MRRKTGHFWGLVIGLGLIWYHQIGLMIIGTLWVLAFAAALTFARYDE